ncbi:hypothetical protein B0H17DRAFT_1153322 [Mycena rosella]|uniref:Uncharacterized protein n=1 Tax=Mycena rosella TaxID=1033263 RepID=A0AAD7B6V6_MYCRO|nr:hypothetical protein B0H17DRAFT_1153322 [Mycena rosella]
MPSHPPPLLRVDRPLGLAHAPPHSPPDSERIDASAASSRLHPLLLTGAIDCPSSRGAAPHGLPLQQYLECTWESAAARLRHCHARQKICTCKSSISVAPSTVPHARICPRRSLRFDPRVRPKLRRLHPNHRCCPSRPSVRIMNCAWRFVCGGSSATVRLRRFGRDAFSPEKVLWGYRRRYSTRRFGQTG